VSGQTGTPEAADQGEVIDFLSDSASHAGPDSVERVATHGNLVFLSAPHAWKIKRAVRFPYLDLNRYLWRSGDNLDPEGLEALPLFLRLRAAIRAMVMIDRANQEDAAAARRYLDRAGAYLSEDLGYIAQPAARLITIGGHSSTGKTTLAAALAPSIGGAPGALGVPFDGVWLTADRDTLVARVAARRHDASDATPDVVDAQLQYEVGEISLAWHVIDAGVAAAEARQHAASQFGLDQ
jgi:hypothetical protein